MKSPWETTLFKLVLQPAVSIPTSYDWSLSWNQSLGRSKLQLKKQNGNCYPSITQSGEVVWDVLSWGVKREMQEFRKNWLHGRYSSVLTLQQEHPYQPCARL